MRDRERETWEERLEIAESQKLQKSIPLFTPKFASLIYMFFLEHFLNGHIHCSCLRCLLMVSKFEVMQRMSMLFVENYSLNDSDFYLLAMP